MREFLIVVLAAVVLAEPQFEYPHDFDCGDLCDYVRIDDGYFDYTLVRSHAEDGVTSYWFNMTSQKWFDESFSDHPVWWHWVVINVPDQLDFTENAMVWVGASSNNDMNGPGPTSRHIGETRRWTQRSNMVTAVIRQVPNQPFTFVDDPFNWERVEDGLIAYTWRIYIESDDPNPFWILRMPMCKSVSKAIDLVQIFMKDHDDHGHPGTNITQVAIGGESKRAWTGWMMPAVDSRVDAIIPVVLSCLNMFEVFPPYYQSLNGWPFAIGNYWLADIMSHFETEEGRSLEHLVDPISPRYRPRLDLPILAISGSVDEFFFLTDYDHYWDMLPGDNRRMWIQENTPHNTNTGPVSEEHWRMMESWYMAQIKGKKMPEFTFHRSVTRNGGSILMHTNEEVLRVTGWMADTPEMVYPRRDFRRVVLDPIIPETSPIWFTEKDAVNLGNGWYELYYSNPPAGAYRAFFMKIVFPWHEEGRELVMSTKAHVLPEGYPFPMCEGGGFQGCRGILR